MNSGSGSERLTDKAGATALPSEFESLYRRAPIGLCIVGRDLRIDRVNEWFAAFNNSTIDDLTGLEVRDAVPDFAAEFAAHLRHVFDTGEPVRNTELCTALVTNHIANRCLLASFYPFKAGYGNITSVGAVIEDISSRRQAESRIILAKQEWEQTFDSVPDLIAITDQTFSIVRVNRALSDRLGCEPQDLLGKPCFEVMHGLEKPPAWCPGLGKLADSPVRSVEVRDDRLKGEFLVAVSPLLDSAGKIVGSVHVARDISELKETQRRLMDEKAFSDSVIDNMPGFFFMVDENGLLKRWNRNCEDIKGYSPEELAGRPAIEFISPRDRDAVLQAFKRAMREGSMVNEHALLTKDGREIPCYASAGRVQFSDANFIVGMEIDISDRIAAEAALEERYHFESFIADLSARFVNLAPEDVDDEVRVALQRITELLGVDRVSLLQFVTDGSDLRATYSFAATAMEKLPPMSMNEDFPVLTECMRNGVTLVAETMDDVPAHAAKEKGYFERLGVKSALAVPISVGREYVCALAILACKLEHAWPDDLIQRLKLVGEIFVSALARKNSEESLRSALTEIGQLKEKLERECVFLREEIKLEHNFGEIIGRGDAIRDVLFKVERVAPTDATVLILGETGTGKELIARAIHSFSQRKEQPLVKVNCAALPPNLIESELFGHEKGAFTGAHARQIGRFEVANGATIFLDEIGELPPKLQAKLLRVLQDGEFERLGSAKTLKVDARIIAATNRDLAAEVEAGRFREDLWYRLNVYPVEVPPLRNRKEDIAPLVRFFVQKHTKRFGKTIDSVPQGIMDSLSGYAWPGNVRELENVIERAIISSQGPSLRLAAKLVSVESELRARRSLQDVEREHIVRVLSETGWIIEGSEGAAMALQINPSTLRGRMRKLGIKRL